MKKQLLLLALAVIGTQSIAAEPTYKFRSYSPGLKAEAGRLTPNPANPSNPTSPETPPTPEPQAPGSVFLPAAMDTGLSQVGNSVVKTYRLEFTGVSSVSVSSLDVTSGSGVFSISANNCIGQTFVAGQNCTFDVAVNTSTAGSFNGQLLVQGSSAGSVVSDESPVRASIASGLASTFVEYLGWNRNFGQVGLESTPASRTIQYMRTGGSALAVHSITSSNADFSVDSVNCTVNGIQNNQLPVTLTRAFSTGDQCFIKVSMNTATAGVKSGSIAIDSNDQNTSNKVIPLSGEVVAPVSTIRNLDGTAFNPNFGSVVVNSTAVQRTVKISAGNAAPLVVNSIAVNGGFTASAQTCSVGGNSKSLPATLSSQSDFCQVTVSHNPVAEGQVAGSLAISTNETNQPAPIALSVNVLPQPTGPDYSQAFGAFALRKVNPAYTGPALRANNVDVYFDQNGQLNAQQLAQAQNGLVSIWYNQANGAHLALTVGDGPRLVVQNGKPTLVFTSDVLGLSGLPTGTDPRLELFVAASGDSTAQNTATASISNRSNTNTLYHILYTHEANSGPGARAWVRGTVTLNENDVTRTGRNVFTYSHNSGTVSLAVDGVTQRTASGLITTLGGSDFDVGGIGRFTQFHNGTISEVILFVGANNTNIPAIASEIKAAN